MSDLPHTANNKNGKPFWPWSKVTNTIQRFGPGATKYRHKYDLIFGKGKFRKVRHYKGPGGETRRTVEIEV